MIGNAIYTWVAVVFEQPWTYIFHISPWNNRSVRTCIRHRLVLPSKCHLVHTMRGFDLALGQIYADPHFDWYRLSQLIQLFITHLCRLWGAFRLGITLEDNGTLYRNFLPLETWSPAAYTVFAATLHSVFGQCQLVSFERQNDGAWGKNSVE